MKIDVNKANELLKNERWNKIIAGVFFLLFASSLYFYALWNNRKIYNRIIEHAAYSTGYFTRFENSKGSRSAIFKFYVNDTLHAGGIGSGAVSKVWAQIQGQYFPVIYNREKPEECDILVFRWDFERYKMQYPDSIQWVQVLYDRAR
ncbi:hypothetical protein [Pinibacter soli]|uniref:Uncharacterized protein n=1 Tax=Pinibacter soli TaxID=3044211 RepID=A0ABT6RGR5_9BACT|nr:hypothetical protein [Pinibacter soli]MDI3321555.1 hypothetical protein [Pinibacter soli]